MRSSLPSTAEILRTLLSAIRANGSQPVLLLMGGQVRRGQSKSDQVAAAATDLFYMPYITIEGLLDIKEEYSRVVRRVGSDLHVPVIALRSTVPADKEYYRDSSHYTPLGSATAGRAIGEALRDLPEVRELTGRWAPPSEPKVAELRLRLDTRPPIEVPRGLSNTRS